MPPGHDEMRSNSEPSGDGRAADRRESPRQPHDVGKSSLLASDEESAQEKLRFAVHRRESSPAARSSRAAVSSRVAEPSLVRWIRSDRSALLIGKASVSGFSTLRGSVQADKSA